MDALGLEDDVVLYDKAEGNYYAYAQGEKSPKPIARFDDLPNTFRAPNRISTPLWSSPVRMTAFSLGIALLVIGVIYKSRRRRNSL